MMTAGFVDLKRDGVTTRYRRGDHVRLNSGGPLMTIMGFESDHETGCPRVVCQWISTALSGELRIGVGVLIVDTLTKEP